MNNGGQGSVLAMPVSPLAVWPFVPAACYARRFQVVLFASMLVSLSGCAGVVSLQPLALPNDRDAVFDPALGGTWEEVKADSDGSRTRYVVARAESGYSVSLGTDKAKGDMHLLKAGDRYLLDVYCPSDGVQLPVHLFFRLRLDKDSAWLAEMQSNWLKEQIKTRGQLRHEVLMEDDDRIVLTASPTELRRYLLPYVADDRAFDEENELKRIK
jgi:hypothetical protein